MASARPEAPESASSPKNTSGIAANSISTDASAIQRANEKSRRILPKGLESVDDVRVGLAPSSIEEIKLSRARECAKEDESRFWIFRMRVHR
jgi:hypothetical protein